MQEPKTNHDYWKILKEASEYVKSQLGTADIAIILGSGLGGISDNFTNVKKIPYTDIPNMPKSTVMGHQGSVLIATYEGKKILCWSGRIHRYEGYRGYKINFLAHMSAFLGCQYLLITCATGGGQKGMVPGTLALLTDYNNLTGINPIETVINDPRFVTTKEFDPKKCFDAELLDVARTCGKGLKDHPEIKSMTTIKEIQKHLFEGSYFWITGPTYESKIECQFLTQLGMDTVGMSTVPEFLAASAIGVKTLGIAMVTDVMDRTEPLSHIQVLQNAERAVPVLKVLLLEIIKKLQLKPEIRAEIDSHINYTGDVSKIEEFPLVQARELIPSKEPQVKDTIGMIHKAMDQLGIKEFDFGCLFLNRVKYAQVSQHYELCCQIPMNKLPNMPSFTTSGKRAIMVIGRLMGSGASCVSICNLDTEGFRNFEAYFVAKILRALNVPIVYSVVASEWVLGGEKAVLPLAGYFYRGFASAVNPSSQLKEGLTEREKIGKIIKALEPSIYTNPTLFGFEGPVKPTPSELLTAAFLKTEIYSTCSLYFIKYYLL